MHERSLIAGLLRRLEEIAAAESASRIVAVRVRLGGLGHVSPEHFREHFREWTRGSVAEGAQLQVDVEDDPESPVASEIVLVSVEVPDD